MSIKVIIVEDEKLAVNRLQRIIKEIDNTIKVVAVADTIRKATEFFKSNTDIDLAFFDIELADGQSFDIFSAVEVPCPVIFTTAYDEYALRAFKVNSIDYLLKPVDVEELRKSLDKFNKLAKKEMSGSIEKLIGDLKYQHSGGFRTRFLSKQGNKMVPVNVSDIGYFYAEEKATFIMTTKGNRHIINSTLDEIENNTDPQLFFRINRGMIINVAAINEVHSWFNGKIKLHVTPAFTDDVFVSRERVPDFRKWMGE